jgi:hypothetical protein
MGNYHPTFDENSVHRLSKTVLSSKVIKAEAYGKETAKNKRKKNDIVLKRQRCMSAKL